MAIAAPSAVRQVIAPPPAPVAPAATAPVPTPPGAAPLAFGSPGGSIAQALKIGEATQGAAGSMLAKDPLTAKYLEEEAKTKAAREEAAAAVAPLVAERQKLAMQQDPAPISTPRLEPLPKPPAEEPKNPMRVMGQLLPVLAALGALRTAEPATNALNAAAAAIGAARNKDKAEFEKQNQLWLQNMRVAVATNEQMVRQYELAIADRKSTMAEKQARMAGLAASAQDHIMMAALKEGRIEPISNLLMMRAKLGEQLSGIVQFAESEATQRTVAQDQSLRGWAELMLQQGKAAQYSPNEVAGRIFGKMQTGGWDTLTDAEKQTLQSIANYEAAQRPPAVPGMGVTVAPQQVAPPGPAAAPAAAAAKPTADQGAGATATSAPPVDRLTAGALTEFQNGQVWTLEDGKPKRVK